MTPEDGYLTLTPDESKRLAHWLTQLEPLPDINSGRWWSMCHGSEYVSLKEMRILSDQAPPAGFALDIIRGNCRLLNVEDVPMP